MSVASCLSTYYQGESGRQQPHGTGNQEFGLDCSLICCVSTEGPAGAGRRESFF